MRPFQVFQSITVMLTLALLLLLASCRAEKETISIDEAQLLTVLIDVHIAEAAAQTLRGATKDSVINAYYDQIFEIHGVDRQEFETTMELYRTDSQRMEALYSKVMTEIERQEVKEEEEEE